MELLMWSLELGEGQRPLERGRAEKGGLGCLKMEELYSLHHHIRLCIVMMMFRT